MTSRHNDHENQVNNEVKEIDAKSLFFGTRQCDSTNHRCLEYWVFFLKKKHQLAVGTSSCRCSWRHQLGLKLMNPRVEIEIDPGPTPVIVLSWRNPRGIGRGDSKVPLISDVKECIL